MKKLTWLASATFRTVYTVSMGDSMYVVDAFQKKSNAGIATPKSEMDLIGRRIKLLRSEVKNAKEKSSWTRT
jgi:phage-related protein